MKLLIFSIFSDGSLKYFLIASAALDISTSKATEHVCHHSAHCRHHYHHNCHHIIDTLWHNCHHCQVPLPSWPLTKTIINHHVSSLQWQLLAAVTLDIVGTVAFCKVPFISTSLIIIITSLIINTSLINLINNTMYAFRWSGRATMGRFQDRSTTPADWRKVTTRMRNRSWRSFGGGEVDGEGGGSWRGGEGVIAGGEGEKIKKTWRRFSFSRK